MLRSRFDSVLNSNEEVLKIDKGLAKDNSKSVEIYYADLLIFGVSILMKDSNDLNKAKRMLEKYKHVPDALDLLNRIDELEKE